MPNQRANAVRVADIRVPESLISTTRGGGQEGDWVPHRRQHSLAENGPLPTTIRWAADQPSRRDVPTSRQEKRRSFHQAQLYMMHNAAAKQERMSIGRPRKTSDPTTWEESQRASLAQMGFTALPIPPSPTFRNSWSLRPPRVSPSPRSSLIHSPRSSMIQSPRSSLLYSPRSSMIQSPRSSLLFQSPQSAVASLDQFQFPDSYDRIHEEDEGSVPLETQISNANTEAPQRKNTLHRLKSLRDAGAEAMHRANSRVRRKSIYEVYERAKQRGVELERKPWVQVLFEYAVYTFLLCILYFCLIGVPLWSGAAYELYWVFAYKLTPVWGWSITMIIGFVLAYAPLLVLFEPDPPMPSTVDGAPVDPQTIPGVQDTALLIPCYKSANIIGPTLEAALRIFPPSHIFVIANGNSPTPLDNTEEVCRPYGVNHIWSPVGSKIVAQFVGCHAARGFRTVLLIDDDCALPPNFPVVSDRLVSAVQCIGYTIKSVGPGSSPGTWCQQAQDLEYKISGLQRALAGEIGSATFPHGAISLWDRQFLIETFHDHPGFSVSEDWFFGHSCRRLGGRIKMCTAVFVETETPASVFLASGGSRGGFGEMTVFSQRFSRWNFFFVNGMWYNLAYVVGSWKLGWWELGAKLFVLQEVYETLLYLLAPFVLPISFVVQPYFSAYLLAGTIGLYLVNAILFNAIHLRRRNESISWFVCLVYYIPYKLVLTFVNIASCYWSLFKYARYFAKRHPKVIEDERAVEVVLHLDEDLPALDRAFSCKSNTGDGQMGRRMAVTAVTMTREAAEDVVIDEKVAALQSVKEQDYSSSSCSSDFSDPDTHVINIGDLARSPVFKQEDDQETSRSRRTSLIAPSFRSNRRSWRPRDEMSFSIV